MSASISNTASQRKTFTEDPLIDPKYGSATWRAEQSIIDILQNHLDAHQRNNPGILPNIQILITCDSTQTQGVKQKWIALESLTKYDSTWNISGLRVHDRGAGFNHGFLGLMGASTKEDDPTTRGGLGEGLKMSVAHLLREGCQVRLGSFTPESTWACSPTVRNNSLIFEGRETNNPGKIRGSFTEVVLPKNSKLEATFQKALDSRNGPGLAQYILDFRRQSDGNLDINKDCLVKSFGQSKVYVKGLFVESIPNAIFSYNLGEKWAITGRDRKHVSKEVLHKAIEKELCECSDTKIVEKVVSYIAKHKSAALEHTILTVSSKVADNSQDLWRATIEKVFKLEPGKNILVSSRLEASATNKISELGYEIIFVNAPDNFLDFIDNLYPDKIVTSQKLSTQNHEIRSRSNRLTDLASAEMPKAAKVKAPSTRTEDHNRKTPPVALEAEFNKLKDSLAASIRLAMKEEYISTDNGDQVIKRIGDLNCDYKFSNSPYPIINLDNIHQLIITFCQENTTPEQRLCAVSKILTASSNSRSEDAYTQNMADRLTVIPPLPAAPIQATAVSNYQNMSSGFEEKRRLQSESDAVSLARAREAHAVLLKPNATLAELLACRAALRNLQPYKNFLFRDGTQTKSLNIKEDNQYTISDVEPYTIPNRELRSKHSSDISFIEKNIHPSNPRWIANDFDLINTEPITTNIPLSPVFLEQKNLEQIREFLKNLPPLPQIDMELSSKQHPPITENTIRAGATRCLTFEKEPYSFSITAKDPATAQTKEYQIFSEIIDGEISFIVKGDDFYKRIFGRSYINVHDIANINFAFQVVSIQSLKHDLEISFLSPNGYQDSEPLTLQNALATDPNKGTTFLKGKIDILYGQQCWDDATRLILDTIQNHMDANKGLRPSLKFTVHNKERETRNISEQELALLDDSWQISQFALQDEGKGFSTEFLVKLGLSTKTPGDRGQFGEGLKLLVAACLRNEIEVSLSSRNWQAKAKTHTINLPDYEKGQNKTFPLLGFELDWRESERLGSESQFRLPENASEAAVNLWGALCNVVDPRQENASKESPAKGIDKFICSERRLFRSTTVEVLPDKQIYEHGLLVNTPNVDRQLGYNFHESITTTRERNDFDLDKAQRLLSDYANSNLLLCPEFARAFIVASVSGNSKCLEYVNTTYSANKPVSAASRIAFSEVFGERALLSWKGRYTQIQNTLSQLTYSPFGLYGTYEDIPRQKQNLERELELAGKIVANEIHLEGSHNLVLAANFYSLIELNLPSTQEFLQQFEEREVTINQEQEKVALETIKRTDTFIIERLERLLANENGAKVLATLGISQENLEKYKQESLNRNPTQIRWQAPEWQILGEALPVGKQLFAYNTKLINNPYELAIIHKHEVCHRISGLRDYETKFQMLLLIFADEDLLRDVGVF